MEPAKSLQAFGPGTARAQDRPRNWSLKLPPANAGLEGVQGREIANSQAPIRNPPIRAVLC
eukprot:14650231-Alexandrium_andersonii.AAC.1